MNPTEPPLLTERRGALGLITLNRPQALNALSLEMVRGMTTALRAWAQDPAVQAVLVHGTPRPGKAPAFCAGGDIRFFHQAAWAGDPALDAFFTEEYRLNHLIHAFPKPYVAWMDGVCMGGGMGISQGAWWRVVTPSSQLAMPETHIGLFPDVGGGWFLARCPGHLGEYLGLTGQILRGAEALGAGLADACTTPAAAAIGLSDWIERLAAGDHPAGAPREDWRAWARGLGTPAVPASTLADTADIDAVFSASTVEDMVARLQAMARGLQISRSAEFARRTLTQLAGHSPTMLKVTLEQIRRARQLSLADALRMERDLVQHCFHGRPVADSDTVEGIRALAVDKDHQPRWRPARLEDVKAASVAAFFDSPWPRSQHPLADLG